MGIQSIAGGSKKGMAEAVSASFKTSNKQSKRWKIPLNFVKDSSFVLFPRRKEKEREEQREQKPLAERYPWRHLRLRDASEHGSVYGSPCRPAFLFAGCFVHVMPGAQSVGPLLLGSGTPPHKTKHSLPMGYDVKLCSIRAQLLSC